jgi:SAM-dependent methyltransferase
MDFKDLFSSDSRQYATFRPQYPYDLFQHVSQLCLEHELAWDCATGNGQAAQQLSHLFKKVIATDPSAAQLAEAYRSDKIEYRKEQAENPSLEKSSVDLLTIAQALHWFNWDAFYLKANEILKPGGIMLALAYGIPKISTEIDELIRQLHNQTLAPYWEQERQLVADLYKDVPFPYPEISLPSFYIKKAMTPADLMGYLSTWSGLKKYVAVNDQNPLVDFAFHLEKVWPPSDAVISVEWHLALKLGRKPTA